MGSPNIISYKKLYPIGGEKGEKTASETFIEYLKEYREKLLAMPAVLARGHYDYLIQIKKDSNPPVLEWKVELINELIPDRLIDIKVTCEKVLDEQTRNY